MSLLLGLIFDLDGTLIDSAADLRQALNALLKNHHRRPLTLPEVKGMTGDGLSPILQRAFAATGEPLSKQNASTLFQDFLELYQNQKASKEQLYPQAVETLTRFRKMGVKIGLCTNKLYAPTLKLLNDIRIAKYFDFVAGSDTFPVYKPHPGHVLGVAHGLGVSPQSCVMVGDSANDIEAAKSAGVISIAVTHGYGANIHTLGADAVIDNFIELPQILRSLSFDFVG